VHDVDDRGAVALDRRHGDAVGRGLEIDLAQRGLRVEPLAVLLVAVEDVGLADVAGVDQVLGELDGRGEAEGEAQLGLDALLGGELGRAAGLEVVAVHGLLAQHVLTGGDGGHRDLEVHGVAGGHVDDIDVGVVHQFAVVGHGAGDAELLGGGLQGLLVHLGQGDDLDPGVTLPAGDVRTNGPAAGSDDGDAKFGGVHGESPLKLSGVTREGKRKE
jgi:hypothetical protein